MKTRYLSGLLAVLLIVAGCTPSPPRPDVKAPVAEKPGLPPQQQIAHWLAQSEQAQSPDRERYQLMAAELLLRENQAELASDLIADIDSTVLPVELQVKHRLVRSRILLANRETDAALALLNEKDFVDIIDQASLPLQIQTSQLRARLYSRQGEHLPSVQERIFMDPLLSREQRMINHEGIWQSLRYVSTADLLRHHHSANNRDYLGWLELASIAKDNQGDIDAQVAQLKNWQSRWSNHPAATDLPRELARLPEFAKQRPRQVALLLPFTGSLAPLGKSIRDGFMAAYFETRGNGGTVPTVRTYDTALAENIVAIYNQAVEDGAELIIGPLRKEVIESLLRQQPALPVPTLALNRIDSSADNAHGMLYQFGLAPEDEARQLARIARNEGHERALVLTPEGSWGDNIADTFIAEWNSLGGDFISRSTFSASRRNYSSVVHSLMQLGYSEDRSRIVRQTIQQNIEFQPRRRDDFDFIFMIARPHEAQAVKPLLAFHFAGDIPVYATSHVYGGNPAPDDDKDINGVRFVDIPWVLTDEHPKRQQLSTELPQGRAYQRMYALGVDSFLLYSRLRQLSSIDEGRVYGETGTLLLGNDGQIHRELMLAIFENGRPRNIPVADGWLRKDLDFDEMDVRKTATRRR